MNWGKVEASADRVVIVATGPSLRGVYPSDITATGAYVIAVNGAIKELPRADAWFTLDPCPRTRAYIADRRLGTTYYMAVPDDYGQPDAIAADHRYPPEEGVVFLQRLTGDGPMRHRHGLSEDPTAIHTGNSAYGALNIAYLMGAQRIALLGVDGTPNGYAWEVGNPRNLRGLSFMFATAYGQLVKRGVQVRNGSRVSRVSCFPRLGPKEALEWIR